METVEIITGAGAVLRISVFVMLIVFFAMAIDLASGIYKAKQRGEARRSEALKRSINKFITYEGGLAIAMGVDILIDLSRFYQLVNLRILDGLPVVTIMVGIFLCAVEFLSVREKADEKSRKAEEKTLQTLAAMLSDERMSKIIEGIITLNCKKDENS